MLSKLILIAIIDAIGLAHYILELYAAGLLW